jgi:hypothetical protein
MEPNRAPARPSPSDRSSPRNGHNPLMAFIALQILALIATASFVDPQHTAAALAQMERSDVVAFVR